MSSVISDALDYLYGTCHDTDIAGETVSYHRGDSSVSIIAVLERAKAAPPSLLSIEPGRLDAVQPNPKNIDHDFSILADDLILDGAAATPRRGDLIKRTFGGSTKVYELMSPSSGGLIWEWQDGYDKRYLIHAKFVRTE